MYIFALVGLPDSVSLLQWSLKQTEECLDCFYFSYSLTGNWTTSIFPNSRRKPCYDVSVRTWRRFYSDLLPSVSLSPTKSSGWNGDVQRQGRVPRGLAIAYCRTECMHRYVRYVRTIDNWTVFYDRNAHALQRVSVLNIRLVQSELWFENWWHLHTWGGLEEVFVHQLLVRNRIRASYRNRGGTYCRTNLAQKPVLSCTMHAYVLNTFIGEQDTQCVQLLWCFRRRILLQNFAVQSIGTWYMA